MAVSLALSIDYSLFLLTRFNEEMGNGVSVETAVTTMLATQGHTVLVSGSTLCLCFLCMLMIPVSTISTMGVGAAVSALASVHLPELASSGRWSLL